MNLSVIFRVLAAVSLFTFLASSTWAEAATVKSINKKKGTVVVEDVSEEDGFAADSTVCVYNSKGKKVGCGKVLKVKKDLAQVKFKSKKTLAKIKSGMEVRLKDGATATASSGGAAEGEATVSTSYKGKKSPFRIWASYSPALATPSVYNKLAYVRPDTTSPETIWESNEVGSTSFLAFNFEFGIPIGSFSLNPGFRYRSFTDSQIDADYSKTNRDLFVRTEQSATALGVWMDFQYFRVPFTPSLALSLTSGLDVDISTVKFVATGKDDSGTQEDVKIANATSNMTLASLRLGAGIDFMFVKSFGAHLGTTVMIPVFEVSKGFSGSAEDSNAAEMEDPKADLEKQLGHKKNSVAYELSVGLVLAF
jgi:hypothetical protein